MGTIIMKSLNLVKFTLLTIGLQLAVCSLASQTTAKPWAEIPAKAGVECFQMAQSSVEEVLGHYMANNLKSMLHSQVIDGAGK